MAGGVQVGERELERLLSIVSCGILQVMLGILNLILRKNEADFNQEHDTVKFAFLKVQLGGDSADRPGAFVTEFLSEQKLVPALLI